MCATTLKDQLLRLVKTAVIQLGVFPRGLSRHSLSRSFAFQLIFKGFWSLKWQKRKKKQHFFQEWFLIMFLIRGKKKKLTQKLRLWIVTERKPGAKFTFLLLLHSSYNLDSFRTSAAFCCANAACEMQNIKLSMLRTWRCSEWEKFKAEFRKPLPAFHPASLK